MTDYYDITKTPPEMPESFLPYLEKHRIYKLFKDMVRDLVINLPKDHLKHMKMFLGRQSQFNKDVDKVILLVSPELNIDVKKLVNDMTKDLGCFAITRRCVLDRYEKHDNYVPGCISPVLMSEVTKILTLKDPVPQTGWIMFDHPCTTREARCMQQDGVLPTVTLVLLSPPSLVPPALDPRTPARSFYQQDVEGLKYLYRATLKEVYISPEDDAERIASKCFNGVRACTAGAQGAGQGAHATGAPAVYRVLLLGARGSGRRTHATALAKQFGLVYLNLNDVINETRARDDDLSQRLKKYGPNPQLNAEIIQRRLAKKDCIDHGWVLTGYPTNGVDFENLDNMPTPPNRIILLNADWATCRARVTARAVDTCTGRDAPLGSGPRVMPYVDDTKKLDAELDMFFSETLAELRAAAGLTAVELDATKPIDQVQTSVQAAVMAAPAFNIECGSQLRNVCAD